MNPIDCGRPGQIRVWLTMKPGRSKALSLFTALNFVPMKHRKRLVIYDLHVKVWILTF